MKLYKLTDSKHYTCNNTKWGENVTHEVGLCVSSPNLCSSDVIHAYKSINLGLLLNPIHAGIVPPILWEAEGDICAQDWGKVGCYKLTTTKALNLPTWYKDKKVRGKVQILFAVLCAEAVLKFFEDKYPKDDRPRKAIQAAKEYLKNLSAQAAQAAEWAARAAAAADAEWAAGWAVEPDFVSLADRAVEEIQMEGMIYEPR